jgi:hypothetical protein
LQKRSTVLLDRDAIPRAAERPSNGIDEYCGDLTFAHEIGHNLGAAHNREELTDDGEVSSGAYSFSHGRTVPGIFRTVMGYTIDGNEPQAALFSSPELFCAGYAWWYERCAPDSKLLEGCQEEAQQAPKGLWAEIF